MNESSSFEIPFHPILVLDQMRNILFLYDPSNLGKSFKLYASVRNSENYFQQ